MVQSLYLRQVVRRHKSEQRGSFFLRWQNFKSDWGWKSSRMAAICSPPRSAHSRLICQTLTWLWLMQSSDTGLLLWAWALDKMYRFHSEATALVHERRVWCWRWRRWMWRDDSYLSVCEPGSNQVMERGVLSHLSHLENDLCCCRKRLVYLSSFFSEVQRLQARISCWICCLVSLWIFFFFLQLNDILSETSWLERVWESELLRLFILNLMLYVKPRALSSCADKSYLRQTSEERYLWAKF